MKVFLGYSLLVKALASANNLLLISQSPVNNWVKWVFYAVLSLATLGFAVVVVLQIKSFIKKEKGANRTWESLWTIVPLIILIILWWLF